MLQPVVTRTQRRIEHKQLMLVIVLILAVAAGSFTLGVMFGQRSGALAGLAADVTKPQVPVVTQVVPPPPPVVAEAPEKQDKLTFYDNLPKGNQAPLGSGINLPREEPKPAAVVKQKEVIVPAPPPPPVPLPKPTTVPVIAAEGAFVIQIASFRAGEDAIKLADRLKKYQLKSFVESADLGEKGIWHRVLAGPYASREDAERAADLLREKERLSALVRQR